MRKLGIAIGIALLLAMFVAITCRSYTVPLVSNDKLTVVAERPLAFPWKDNAVTVHAGESKQFSLWSDFFDYPLFIYSFRDDQRFLCIYNNDTAILVFVVDFSLSTPNSTKKSKWPPNEATRHYLDQRATTVVLGTQGRVRLPSISELQEASSNLTLLSPREFKAASLPVVDVGLYRGYWPKETLLAALSTNRQDCWP